MRPLPGDDTFAGRSRSTSFVVDDDISPLAGPYQAPQMTYFLADEKSMEASQFQSSSSPSKQRDPTKRGTYGIESIETTISSLPQDSDDQDEKVGQARHNWKKNLAQHMSRGSDENLTNSRSPSPKSSRDVSRNISPSQPRPRRFSPATMSRPLTPLYLESPAPGSTLSSPNSSRNSNTGSFTDDVASQAIISSGEEEREEPTKLMDSGSAPQLVMPSIKMPSRRPFTERGKNMGRLKVLIAGDSGVGKTSLIKAIVQICEDIVHVDPLSTTPISLTETGRKSSKSKLRAGSADMQATSEITEVYASTRAYPAWWSDFDEVRVLRRRKSMGDKVLERNLCFVDTPGYGNATSCMESITPVVDYVQSQLRRASSIEGMGDSDLISILSGNGGSLVDVVFYVILHKIKPVDIEYLRRLSPLTNIIPLVAQSDTLSSEQLLSLKSNILSEFQAANIRPFSFGLSPEDSLQSSRAAPYAISTVTTRDSENMDASLLMSPDYVQPLVPTELAVLVEQIFDRDSISWLRHSAAKKFIQWRNSSDPTERPQSLYRPLSMQSSTAVVSSSSQALTASVGGMTSYTLARITDHIQREERLAQVQLSKWASDLQRNLQNERARFETLARGERAVWLTERLGECVQDGTIIPVAQARQFSAGSGALVKQDTYSRKTRTGTSIDPHDPLGLLQLNADMKRRGWITLQVVSGVGIIGGLALWISKSWQTDNNTLSWVFDWTKIVLIDW